MGVGTGRSGRTAAIMGSQSETIWTLATEIGGGRGKVQSGGMVAIQPGVLGKKEATEELVVQR